MPDTAELVKVAEAIKTELATAQVAGAFVGLETFTPERNYADWAKDIEELDLLRVDVIPVAYEENDLDTEGSVGYLCTVNIGVRRWFPLAMRETNGRIKADKMDRLILFVQELNEFFCKNSGRNLAAYPDAAWEETKIRVTYSQKHLARHQMFLGIVRVGYTVSKDL